MSLHIKCDQCGIEIPHDAPVYGLETSQDDDEHPGWQFCGFACVGAYGTRRAEETPDRNGKPKDAAS